MPVNMFPWLDENCGGSNEADSIDEACSPLNAADMATSTETKVHDTEQVTSVSFIILS